MNSSSSSWCWTCVNNTGHTHKHATSNTEKLLHLFFWFKKHESQKDVKLIPLALIRKLVFSWVKNVPLCLE